MNGRTWVWRTIDGIGASRLCATLAAGRLQILCYHGFSFVDEHLFRGKLFMAMDRFEARLEWLRRNGYVALELGEAVQRLAEGRLRKKEIAITIDDGFHGVAALAAPRLHAFGFPAMVYVTSYYVIHPNPIFRLAIQYMAWKSGLDSVDISGLTARSEGHVHLRGPQSAASLGDFYEKVEVECTEDQRVEVAREFGHRVGVDYEELRSSRRLSLMTASELAGLRELGLDVQLHTHRHHLPLTATGIAREIDDNRAALAPAASRALEHLCYPSGVWDAEQWPILSAMGVKTATTCLPGFNSRTTPLLGLRRFLDGQDISLEEFGAEMRGVKDLLRRVRRTTRDTPSKGAHAR